MGGINYRIVIRTIGAIIGIVGIFLLVPLICDFIIQEGQYLTYIKSILICLAIGFPMFHYGKGNRKIAKREGYLIVAFGWLSLCYFGTLPYILAGQDIDFFSGFFESTSGFTTTGATIFSDIEALPQSLLVWRSLTQWIGGMGIIVLTVALFPILGIGGVELFTAEAPGPTNQKIHPKIKEVAKRLWLIYFSLTVIVVVLLKYVGGMCFFDSFNHGLTTMATGGFSTKNSSLAHFNSPTIEYIVMLFMFIGGVNYTILYYLLKARFKKVLANEEFRFYSIIIFLIIIFGTTYLYSTTSVGKEPAFRYFAFQVISIITTTGYITADYTSWGMPTEMFFFMLLFVGGCAGSTSGGVKIIRHLVFFKNSLLEFKRILHPRAYVRLKIDGEIIRGSVIMHILVFLIFYLIIFVLGSLIMVFLIGDMSHPFLSSIGAVATCLGNVGPAIGALGPVDDFSELNHTAKVFLSFIMIVGRLELFTILVLFTTYFWKNS